MTAVADADVIDLRQIVSWWRAKLWLLCLAAFLGFGYGLYQFLTFQPVYTAEARIFVPDWRAQLESVTERGKIALGIPQLPPLTGERDGFVYTIRGTGLTADAALDARAAQARALLTAAAQRDKVLEPYAEALRHAGVPEVTLTRPAPVVLESPNELGRASFRKFTIALYGLGGMLAAFVLGSLGFLFTRGA